MSNVIVMPAPKQDIGAPAGIEAGYLLTSPDFFEGYKVVTSFYEKPHNGFLHGHLVVFHMHQRLRDTPAVIPPDAPVFGIGHVEYDDDAGKAISRRLAEHVTYAQAIDFLAKAMLRSVS